MDAGTDAGSADEACALLAQARCTKRQQCEPAVLAADFADLATCEARDKANCLSSISAPSTGNTPASLTACAAAYSSWSCADWYNGITPAACKVQSGTKANGSLCSFAAQCSSAYCAVFRGANCGTCAPQPSIGTSCAAGNACGGNGLYCDSFTDTCQALVTSSGQSCDAGSCGYQLGCVIPTDGGGGTCQALGSEVDAGCDGAQRLAPTCSRPLGFTCLRRHCVAELHAQANGACGVDLDAGTVTRCMAGSTCTAADAGSVCVAPVAEGLACDTAAGVDCLNPARCVSTDGMATDGGPVVGTCKLASPLSCQ
jgi:hypothetical protein